jgi:ubiquinone biosynthesis monooxygenase Coq6
MLSVIGVMNKSRIVYSCIRITNNLLENGLVFQSRDASSSSRMKEERLHYDIIVAGGGMVGTAMACALAQAPRLSRKRILLLEGSPQQSMDLKPQYSNCVSSLNTGTKSLLQSIGAWKHIASARYKTVKKLQVWEACSDAMITFSHDDMVEDIAYIVENDVLLAAVNREIQKLAGNLTVIYDAKIKGYELPQRHGKTSDVRVHLERGSSYTCSLLIGADGANSQVRKAMGIKYLSWNYNQMGVVATLKLSEPTENVVAWQRFLPTGPVALLPLTDCLSSLVWSTSIEHAKELLSLSNESFVDSLNDALREQFPRDKIVDTATQKFNDLLEAAFERSNAVRQLHPSISTVEEGSRAAFPLGFGHATQYVGKGVVLVGDAAHRVHPLAGQGVNLGFGDVKCLSELLCEAVFNGNSVGSLLHLLKYETLRQRHNLPTMLATDGLQKLYGTTLTPFVVLRSLGLQLTHILNPVKKMIMNHAAA